MDWISIKHKFIVWLMGEKWLVDMIEAQAENVVYYAIQSAYSRGVINKEAADKLMDYIDKEEVVMEFLSLIE